MSEEFEKCAALEKLQDERWEAHRREHDMINEARHEAKDNVDRRLEGMNELRAQIDSERGTFLKVADFKREHQAVVDKVDGIYKFIYMAMGAIAIITVLIQVFVPLIKKGP